jgi:hypothetical protein
MRAHGGVAEPNEIDVEVGVHRAEVACLDAGGCCAVVQPVRCGKPGLVVVAGGVEAAQRRRKRERAEMIGRQGGYHRQ